MVARSNPRTIWVIKQEEIQARGKSMEATNVLQLGARVSKWGNGVAGGPAKAMGRFKGADGQANISHW